MSWLEGETDVLEKLHGALTEVGLPACETTDVQECKTTERATTTINKQSLCQRVNLSDEADPRLYRKNEGASENKHIRRQMKKITQDGHRRLSFLFKYHRAGSVCSTKTTGCRSAGHRGDG